MGHLDYGPIATALAQSNYDGYLSAEVFPLPTSEEAARQTIESIRTLFSAALPH